MNQVFKIGDFCFRLVMADEICPPTNFMKFASEEAPSYEYHIQMADELPEIEGRCMASRANLRVLETTTGECRYIGILGHSAFYACYHELSETLAEVVVNRQERNDLSADTVFTSLLALEHHLLPKGEVVLHCAYVEHQGKAMLFSAPSETGKTTQANLWGQYRGSRTVNGDRALLAKKEDTWYAQGWPVCGSSGVCENETMPIHAIVMLSQGKENQVRRIQGREAFQLLYSQLTINSWNREATLQAMELAEDIVKTVPMYHLSCTISEEAVQCLEKELYDGRE